MMKQKGFTLLELLVVITLLAVLAVGALVAYDGIGENAESTAAAFNAGSLDRAVRNYRAVEQAYPDQWDNLAQRTTGQPAGGSASSFIADQTREVFGAWRVGQATSAVQDAFFNVVRDVWGMEELQHVDTVDPQVTPAKMHNEGSNLGAVETDFAAGEFDYISVVPSVNGLDPTSGCLVGAQSVSTTFSGTSNDITLARRLNAMNDAMGINRCHLVIALGFGGDAASSTSRSSASIVAAPSYSSKTINPAVNYARYVGLFHVARTDDTASSVTISETDFFPRPKLIGFVDPAGNPIDVNASRARSGN